MKALLNLFTVKEPGVLQSMSAVMPQPMEFSWEDLHCLSLGANHWANQNPGSPAAKRVAFKVDAVRGAWRRAMGEGV